MIHGLASLAATLAATIMLSHVKKSLSASFLNILITPTTITYACDEKFPEVQLRNRAGDDFNHLKATVGFEPGWLSRALTVARQPNTPIVGLELNML